MCHRLGYDVVHNVAHNSMHYRLDLKIPYHEVVFRKLMDQAIRLKDYQCCHNMLVEGYPLRKNILEDNKMWNGVMNHAALAGLPLGVKPVVRPNCPLPARCDFTSGAAWCFPRGANAGCGFGGAGRDRMGALTQVELDFFGMDCFEMMGCPHLVNFPIKVKQEAVHSHARKLHVMQARLILPYWEAV